MKKLAALFIGIATICLYATATLALADDRPDEDEAILRHLKTVLWPKAYREQDTALLDRLLHDRFEMIDNAGNRSTKENELAFIRTNKWDPGEFRYEIERLDIFDGRFAVIDGTGIAEKYTYKSSNYLLKESGRWRAVGSHVSGYQKRQPPPGKQ